MKHAVMKVTSDCTPEEARQIADILNRAASEILDLKTERRK
jgi:hypothetical protein